MTIRSENVSDTLSVLKKSTSIKEAVRATGVPRSTLVRWATEAGIKLTEFNKELEKDFTPDTLGPVEDLITERKRKFAHVDKSKKARALIDIRVKINGPIAISHFGDPHVDDDGTDLALIEHHVETINRTKGMYAANIGDTTNNWMGRLARLYSEQSTSAQEAWQLCEWFVSSTPWLYFLDGNHGAWSGAGDPVKWMLKNCSGVHGNQAARLNLKFPNGRDVRVNARHDFRGHSMWNTAHGPAKAVQMGWRDHIAICGHLHISGYQVLKDPASGLVSHVLRVASYKKWDRYADDLGLPDQNIFANAVTIINPRYADNDARLIHTCFDVEEGAEYLTWLRSKKGNN